MRQDGGLSSSGYNSMAGGVRRTSPVRTLDGGLTGGLSGGLTGGTRYPQTTTGGYSGQSRVLPSSGNYSSGYIRQGESTSYPSYGQSSPYSGAGVRLTGDSLGRTYPLGQAAPYNGGISTAGLRPVMSHQINTSGSGLLTSPYIDPVTNQLVRFNPMTNEIVDARTNDVLRNLTPRKAKTGTGEDEVIEETQEEEAFDADQDDLALVNQESVMVDTAYFQAVNKYLHRIFERIDSFSESNTVISPISIYLAFSILAEGVSGVSKQEVFEFFNFDTSEVVPPQELAYLLQFFSNSNENAKILMANSAWINQKIIVAPEYVEHITEKYLATVESVNMNDAATKEDINSWIEEQMEGTVANTVTATEPTTMLMLISTIYFKAKWIESFEVMEPNEDLTFFTGEEEQVETTFMRTTQMLSYLANEVSEYIVLPYLDTPAKLVLYLPRDGFDPMASLDLDTLIQVAKIETIQSKLELIMPKFDMNTRMNLRDILAGLGCSKIFDPNQNSDFKDIFEGPSYISQVIHEAKIEIDEDGGELARDPITEFEAGEEEEEEGSETLTVLVNRPFSFFLVDAVSSMILFTGVYRRPE